MMNRQIRGKVKLQNKSNLLLCANERQEPPYTRRLRGGEEREGAKMI